MAWPKWMKRKDGKHNERRNEARTKNRESNAERKRLKNKERELNLKEREADLERSKEKAKTSEKLRSEGKPTHKVSVSFNVYRKAGKALKRDKRGRFAKRT